MKILLSILLLSISLFSKELTIETEDGYKLYGWLEYPQKKTESNKIAFFSHQFGSDHTIWNELASDLRKKGFATVMVDLRGHGKSIMQNGKENAIINDQRMDHIREALAQSKKKVDFTQIPSDLILWLDTIAEIEDLNMEKLVLIGSSLGAGALIPVLGDYEAKAYIGISPGSSNPELTKEVLEFSSTPTLFIAGKNDPLNAQDRATNYTTKAMRGTNITISSSGHGTVLMPFIKRYIFSFIENYM